NAADWGIGMYSVSYDQMLSDPQQLTPDNPTPTPAPTPSPTPSPTPTPTPTPSPAPSPSATIVNGDLGANAFMLQDGTMVDAYVSTAKTSGQTAIAAGSYDFATQIGVLQYDPATGTTTTVALDTNDNFNTTSSVKFNAVAGDQYEILIASGDWGVGKYQFA